MKTKGCLLVLEWRANWKLKNVGLDPRWISPAWDSLHGITTSTKQHMKRYRKQQDTGFTDINNVIFDKNVNNVIKGSTLEFFI